MIVNAYSVVAAFTSVLELVLGVVAVAGAWRILRRARGASSSSSSSVASATDVADAGVLGLFLPGIVLAALAASSVPLLGLLLQSYVPQWPGVMCVRGVLRIGTGSQGAPSLLPTLLTTLAVTKPLLIFATGAWISVHLVNRATRAAPLSRTVVGWIAVSGLLAVVDASAETAYLFIPKQERFLEAGCCTIPLSATTAAGEVGDPVRAAAAFFGLAAGSIAAFVLALRATSAESSSATARVMWTVGTAAGSVATVWAGGPFLADVLSPTRLSVPGHACAYCLLGDAPEYALGAALIAAGAFAAAWAATVVLASRGSEAEGAAGDLARRLLRFAAFAVPASAAMALVGWRLA
ncbi:MAG: hypothetical protein K8T90_06010 [Planctomycetes bacterium]|nr:hypothetical protein [Planctomycetota bacterium]